jgi:hypothetical protein
MPLLLMMKLGHRSGGAKVAPISSLPRRRPSFINAKHLTHHCSEPAFPAPLGVMCCVVLGWDVKYSKVTSGSRVFDPPNHGDDASKSVFYREGATANFLVPS